MTALPPHTLLESLRGRRVCRESGNWFFLSFFVISYVVSFATSLLRSMYIFLGRAWAEGKVELSTSRLCADSDQETDSVYWVGGYLVSTPNISAGRRLVVRGLAWLMKLS